ncbi:hypothetical protein [Streptomyces yatensis]|uniref:Anaphase-promoting complex subunit 4 WD40 domain-containing protein n=1 Tax=Streptomyces yatensis TaxID=155177 RepID=A0ABN2IBK8_9ACTN|nr:hypothetical protein [Streptomyces yatensis]
MLAERERLRHELNGPPAHPPRIPPEPPRLPTRFSPDGNALRIHPQAPATLAVPGDTSIAQLAFSPDGRTLATLGFQDKTIHLWRLE